MSVVINDIDSCALFPKSFDRGFDIQGETTALYIDTSSIIDCGF